MDVQKKTKKGKIALVLWKKSLAEICRVHSTKNGIVMQIETIWGKVKHLNGETCGVEPATVSYFENRAALFDELRKRVGGGLFPSVKEAQAWMKARTKKEHE